MVLDDERLKARIHFDEKEALKELDKVLREIDKAFKKKKWTFKNFFGDDGGGLDKRMVQKLQDYETLKRNQDEKREKDEKARDARRVKDYQVFLNRRKVMWADHERNRLQKEARDRLKVERDVINKISAMYRQMHEGTLDQSRVYAPGTTGDKAQTRFRKALNAQQLYRTQGAGNRLYTFFANVQKQMGRGPNADDTEYETNSKAAAFQRRINPWTMKGRSAAEGVGSKIPTLVKLAGFSMGMAGIGQLGKMIIDSSPILQVMLKLMQTGFTFFLRPIGDMMGMIIRPFAILMLKYGVAWYRESLRLLPQWTDIGNSLMSALGLSDEPLANKLDDIIERDKTMNEGELGPIGALASIWQFFDKIDAWAKSTFGNGSQQYRSYLAYGDTGDGTTGPGHTSKDVYDAMDKWWQYQQESVYGPGWQGPMPPRQENVGNLYGGYNSAEAQAIANDPDALRQAMAETKRKYPHLFRGAGEYNWQSYTPGQPNDGLGNGQLPPHLDPTSPDYNPYGKPLFETGGYEGPWSSGQRKAGLDTLAGSTNIGISPETQVGDIPGIVASASADFESLWDNAEDIMKVINHTNIQGMDRETKIMLENVIRMKRAGEKERYYREQASEAMKASYDKMLTVLRSLKIRSRKEDATGAQKSLGRSADFSASVVINTSGGYGAQLSGFRGANGKVYPSVWEALSNNVGAGSNNVAIDISNGQRWKFHDTTGVPVQMAKGGIINEPIFGLGQRTGKSYMLGEAGPETVTPGVNKNTKGGGDSYSFTFNVTGVNDSGDFERRVMPMIKKLLKEDTSRRGIL